MLDGDEEPSTATERKTGKIAIKVIPIRSNIAAIASIFLFDLSILLPLFPFLTFQRLNAGSKRFPFRWKHTEELFPV
jgi:hypothetical protein